jgi:hypothetical protein
MWTLGEEKRDKKSLLAKAARRLGYEVRASFALLHNPVFGI